jgi:hypothetical protein
MSPLIDTRTGLPADRVEVQFPEGVDVRRAVVGHNSVTFYDAEGREALVVDRPAHPGAGLALDLISDAAAAGSR